jgi:hypothetical protein
LLMHYNILITLVTTSALATQLTSPFSSLCLPL